VPWHKQLVADLTVEALVRARAGTCMICGGQSDSGTGFVRVLRFSHVNVIPPWLSTPIYHLGMINKPVGGRSSDTQSHSIDMNNSNKHIVVATVLEVCIVYDHAIFL
jgi:hypothetical protein